MVARRKKEFASGEGSNYVSRKHAMKKLQLTLKDFRRLCILKGIHPREPRNRKRAQKGNLSKIQTLFHEKDIRFLLHEPIVWKFREFKVFLRKVKKAQDKGNYETVERLHAGGKPKYTLDHIVKERYPTFVDAVRDLEDCLCLCFLYSTFPVSAATPAEKVGLCKRLTVEFMHYVIEAKALRKVFVSIKGYYYQAEILGQTVTWIVPHTFAYAKPENVDFKLMSVFVDFYTTMLGFVNFRLFHKLNLKYPPALVGFATEPQDKTDKTEEVVNDRVAALNQSLLRTVANDEPDSSEGIDIIAANGEEDDEERMAEARKQADELTALQSLFKGLKFFISREVPREALVFLVRAFGGEVSWDATAAAAGATFGEDDVSVTHQICDRPKAALAAQMAKHVERFYVQPQWVFDSVNQRKLLAVHEYFVGETLPAHLSPFVSTERRVGDYVPPEERRLLGLDQEEEEEEQQQEQQQEEDEEQVEDEEDDDEDDDDEEDDEDDEEDEDEEEEEDADTPAKKKSGMKVEAGRMEQEDVDAAAAAMATEEMRLRTSMIKKKHRGLYRSMMKARKKRVHESKQLERKRKIHDEGAKQQKTNGKATPEKAKAVDKSKAKPQTPKAKPQTPKAKPEKPKSTDKAKPQTPKATDKSKAKPEKTKTPSKPKATPEKAKGRARAAKA